MSKRIGVFGDGYWSRIIQEKLTALKEDYEVVFVADSKSNHISRLNDYKIDWAVVASPNSTHYEIVETCLRHGIAVFCEKPLVSNPEDARILYALAKKYKVQLYVDDVFVWRDDTRKMLKTGLSSEKKVEGRWQKDAHIKKPLRCLNDLLYHHLYLIAELTNFSEDYSLDATVEEDKLLVTVETKTNQVFNLSYTLNALSAEHVFNGLDLSLRPNDALKDMLNSVLTGAADASANKSRTLWATETLFKIKKLVMPSVGVIGGGIFGSTAAVFLAGEGCDVTLYQQSKELLEGASGKNQLRLHRGYHYPRSKSTAKASKHSDAKFKSYYGKAVDTSNRHLYAISKEDSLTTEKEYEAFLDSLDLEYKKLSKTDPAYKLFNDGVVSAIYEVPESLYDAKKLRTIFKEKFAQAGVNAKYGKKAKLESVRKKFDIVVTATYANPLSLDRSYQFEVCEKPIVRLPDEFKRTSILILDGPFMGIDPLPGSDDHILDSVKDAIHATNIGDKPLIPEHLEAHIDAGLVKDPPKSRYGLFVKTGKKFYRNFNPLKKRGSYFVVRAVLPFREHDDARPSIVRRIDENTYDVFSGKVSTAPTIGQKLVETLLYAEDDIAHAPESKK